MHPSLCAASVSGLIIKFLLSTGASNVTATCHCYRRCCRATAVTATAGAVDAAAVTATAAAISDAAPAATAVTTTTAVAAAASTAASITFSDLFHYINNGCSHVQIVEV